MGHKHQMKKLKHIYMWPVWIFALGTQAKSFKANPVIGSAFLNRMGLHVVRVLLAQLVARFRWALLAPLMPKNLRRDFHRNGFVVVENFLDGATIKKVRNEIGAYGGEVRQMTQGDTATQRILLDRAASSGLPLTAQVATGMRLRRYLAYGGAKFSHSIMYIQRIHNGFRSSHSDPQKTMHSDTFHPTMKAWLFLEDVTPEKGPFTYVPGSARLSWKRVKWEYRRSVGAAQMDDKYSEKGSLRATADDLAQMGLPTPQGITAKAGTLVIANTNGFHGRGQAAEDASRLEIWAYSRHNPFSPWPGLPLDFVLRIKHQLMHWNWRRLDKRAKIRNSKASWHLINADEMVGSYRQAHVGKRNDTDKKASR